MLVLTNGAAPHLMRTNEMTSQALKIARAEVSKHEFGSQAWEAAMEVVRALVQAEIAAAPKFVHTSREGDVWSV